MAFINSFHGLQLRSKVSTEALEARNPKRWTMAKGRPRKAQIDSSKKNDQRADDSTLGKIRAPRQIRGGGRRRVGYVASQGARYGPRLPPNPPGMRVAAGSAKGRKIISPNVYLRPMMGKVREALYSMLSMLEILRPESTILDLYAGSGSVGIEGLSRGMGRAVFVDFAMECTESVQENLSRCNLETKGTPVCAKVEDFLTNGTIHNNNRHYDLITITPPYEEVDYSELMSSVTKSDCVGEGTFVVVEYPVELGSLPPAIGHRLVGIRNRKYGRTVLALYACQPGPYIDPRPEEFIISR